MQVYFYPARKQATCADCPSPILLGQRLVYLFIKRESGRHIRLYKHWQCFVQNIEQFYTNYTYTPKPRGIKQPRIDPQHKKERNRLSVRWYRLDKKAQDAAAKGDMEGLSRINDERMVVRSRMEELGGAPGPWYGRKPRR